MKKTLLSILISTTFMGAAYAQATLINTIEAATPAINAKTTQTASWKMGEVVMRGNITSMDKTTHAVYRKFLGVTTDGNYVVQDFYGQGDTVRTVPYLTTKENVTPLVIRPQTGTFVMFYPNGNKREEGAYINGQEDGLWKFWHENGRQFFEGVQKDGFIVGQVKAWHKDGQRIVEANIQVLNDEAKKNPSVSPRDENASREINFNFSAAQLDKGRGTLNSWYENGTPFMQVIAPVGSKEFSVTQWYENGQISMAETFLFGEPAQSDRPVIMWAPDGSRFSEMRSLEGGGIQVIAWYLGTSVTSYQLITKEEQIQSKSWYENGQLSSSAKINLKGESTFTLWHENGQEMAEGIILTGGDKGKAFFNDYANLVKMPPDEMASVFLKNNGFIKITGFWDENGKPISAP